MRVQQSCDTQRRSNSIRTKSKKIPGRTVSRSVLQVAAAARHEAHGQRSDATLAGINSFG